MEHFGEAKIVAGAAGHREAPKAWALAEGLRGLPQKKLKNRRYFSHLSAFQSFNRSTSIGTDLNNPKNIIVGKIFGGAILILRGLAPP